MGRYFPGQSYNFGHEEAAAGEHRIQGLGGSVSRLESKDFIPKNAPCPSQKSLHIEIQRFYP